MTRSDDQRIADILDACDELGVVVGLRRGGKMSDLVLLRAAERLLEIMGEAAANVSEEGMTRYAGVDWRNMSRLRIVLAHHYHRTDPELIWSFANEDVPALATALRT